jgi:hypothetical protein
MKSGDSAKTQISSSARLYRKSGKISAKIMALNGMWHGIVARRQLSA